MSSSRLAWLGGAAATALLGALCWQLDSATGVQPVSSHPRYRKRRAALIRRAR